MSKITVKELKEALEQYPDDYQLAIEKQNKDGSREWVIEPDSHKYFRIVVEV